MAEEERTFGLRNRYNKVKSSLESRKKIEDEDEFQQELEEYMEEVALQADLAQKRAFQDLRDFRINR